MRGKFGFFVLEGGLGRWGFGRGLWGWGCGVWGGVYGVGFFVGEVADVFWG